MDLSSPYFPVRVKQEPLEDGYDPMVYHHQQHHHPQHPQPMYPDPGFHHHGVVKSEPPSTYTHTIAEADSAGAQADGSKKKRGKKRKIKPATDDGMEPSESMISPSSKLKVKQERLPDTHFKERKKVDRFNGMPEEEVVKRTLPDHLVPNLDIVIIGINPGLFAAYKGHHYAGPGNHFWKCIFLAGLIPEPMTSDDDYRMLEHGIGFTNIVARTTRGSADLTRKEIKDGAKILLEKLQKYTPKIAVFNGKGIYEVFSGRKNFDFGKQPDMIEGTNTLIFVMPSSSARCAQLPRAIDKVPFYEALKKLREHMAGRMPDLLEAEVTFPDVKLKIESDPDAIKSEPFDIKEEPDDCGGNGSSTMSSIQDMETRQADPGAGDRPKKKSYKKKATKKKKTEESSPDSCENGVVSQGSPEYTPHQHGFPGSAADYGSQMHIKQEKQEEMGYGYRQPYGGSGYPPPPAHSGPYFGNPPNPSHYGGYPSHPQNPYVTTSGTLNQLESFVDQIPNIGPPGLPHLPPPAHGGGYPQQGQSMGAPPAQYPQGPPMHYPPPPPAHEHHHHQSQVNGASYPHHQSNAVYGFSSSPPPSNPPPAHSPGYSGPIAPSATPQVYAAGQDTYTSQRSPVYTDLDSVQVKQERLDPGYGTY